MPNLELVEKYYNRMNQDESLKPKTKATAIQIGKPVNITKRIKSTRIY